jgi:hypothetical protein
MCHLGRLVKGELSPSFSPNFFDAVGIPKFAEWKNEKPTGFREILSFDGETAMERPDR